MSSNVISDQSVSSKVTLSPLMQTFGALVFGAAVLFAVGFMPMDAAHNAAHDTRHSLAFPCH